MLTAFHRFFIATIVFCSILLNASNYDDDVLYIYSKIMPRFVLMSSAVKNLNSKINICIVSEDVDEMATRTLIEKSNANYPHGIKNYTINFIRTDYSNIHKCQNSQLAFLFDSSPKNIDNFVEFSIKNSILTISYAKEFLKNGVDISLFIGRKIIPYLNMNSIEKKDIKLNNILLRISKIYSSKDD